MRFWYVRRCTRVRGPFPVERLHDALKDGKVTSRDMVSRSRRGPWKPASLESLREPHRDDGQAVPVPREDMDLLDLTLSAFQDHNESSHPASRAKVEEEGAIDASLSVRRNLRVASAIALLVPALGACFAVIDGGTTFSYAVMGVGLLVAISLLFLDIKAMFVWLASELEGVSIDIEKPAARSKEVLPVEPKRERFLVLSVLGQLFDFSFFSDAGPAVAKAVAVVVVVVVLSGAYLTTQVDIGNVASLLNRKVVQTTTGKAIFTDNPNSLSHLRLECNNGLIIDADWKRNPLSDFGYDIYEPTVSETTNRLAVMMAARTHIAAYLRGEYD